MASPKETAEQQVKAALAKDWDALRRLYADDVRDAHASLHHQ